MRGSTVKHTTTATVLHKLFQISSENIAGAPSKQLNTQSRNEYIKPEQSFDKKLVGGFERGKDDLWRPSVGLRDLAFLSDQLEFVAARRQRIDFKY